jgi:hypothetical protein
MLVWEMLQPSGRTGLNSIHNGELTRSLKELLAYSKDFVVIHVTQYW